MSRSTSEAKFYCLWAGERCLKWSLCTHGQITKIYIHVFVFKLSYINLPFLLNISLQEKVLISFNKQQPLGTFLATKVSSKLKSDGQNETVKKQ